MATRKSQSPSSSGSGSRGSSVEPLVVPLIHDSLTFSVRQTKGLREMERQAEAELKRRRRDWEREVDRMREEFLRLYPVPHTTDGHHHHPPPDPLVAKRRGSTDILDMKRMQTMLTEGHTAAAAGGGSESGDRKFRLRFDVTGYDVETIEVSVDAQTIVVQATKTETVRGREVRRQFARKIQNPTDVDMTDKLTSHLTTDGILVVEALLQAKQPPPPAAHVHQNKVVSDSSASSPHHHRRRRSSSNSAPGTPNRSRAATTGAGATEAAADGTATLQQSEVVKLGVPVFREGGGGCRRLYLVVFIGALFRPRDVTVQVIKDNRIVVKARHEEISSERVIKSKFSKEFELTERIEPETVRGGLDGEGRIVVHAYVKGGGGGGVTRTERRKDRTTDEDTAPPEEVEEEEVEVFDPMKGLLQCNVLNLSSFPPTMPASAVIPNSNGEPC